MKKFFLIIGCVLLLSGASAFAQETQAPASPGEELYQKWARVRQDLERKDFEGAKTGLDELEEACADNGLTSVEELSASMIKQAKGLIQASEMKGALMLIDSAAKISPNYPPPYFAKGWAYFSQDKTKALLSVDSFIEGFINSADDFWWSFYYTGNKFTSLLFAAAALFSLFGLFIALRYVPLLAHDAAETLKKPDIEGFLKNLILPALLLVLLLILGYWWAVATSMLALWFYFNKKEKAIAVVFFVLLVFMPDAMRLYSNFLQGSGNRLLWVMDEVNKGQVSGKTGTYLEGFIASNPEDEPAIMALAMVRKKEGRYKEAEDLYWKLLTMRPDSSIYRNNLGNVRFLTGNIDGALGDYSAAIQSDPNVVLPYFNLSQVYGEKLMFTERENADLAARERNPALVARLRDLAGQSRERMVFDERIPAKTFWEIVFSKKDEYLAESFWQTSVKVLPLKGARLAGISFIVLAFAINAFRLKGTHSHYCKKCGAISCTKCQKPFYSKELCPQCQHIFVKLDGVEARDRVRKMLEIRETQRRSGLFHRASSWVLPGSGHFLMGHPVRGFAFMGAFLFLVKDIFFGHFFEVPYDFNLPFIQPDLLILSLILAIMYLLTQADIYRLTK